MSKRDVIERIATYLIVLALIGLYAWAMNR